MIKLQPGYHCNDCPCFNEEWLVCQVLDAKVKRDYHDFDTPAMPLAECPLELMVLTKAAGHVYVNTKVMGIFDEDEYDLWLDQRGDDDN